MSELLTKVSTENPAQGSARRARDSQLRGSKAGRVHEKANFGRENGIV